MYRIFTLLAAVLSVLPVSKLRAQNPARAGFSISDTVGCAPLQVKFKASSQNVVRWQWDFGNGNSSSLSNPTNVYLSPGKYTVKLRTTDASGNTDSFKAELAIRVVPKPVAEFSAPVRTACPGEALQFVNASAKSDSFVWDFGDGTTSSGITASHSYKFPGKYTVKLMAINSLGCSDVSVKTGYITIHPLPDPQFSADRTSVCDSTQNIKFTTNGKNITHYYWSFGDGTTSNNAQPVHRYPAAGTYTVKLRLINTNGCMDSSIMTDYIQVGRALPPPIEADINHACANTRVSFRCLQTDALSWDWNFGDGTTSNEQNPAHLYSGQGSYTVRLTTVTAAGCRSTAVMKDFVLVKGTTSASFTGTASGCAPLTARFTNTSKDAISYIWDFGDSTTSTDTTGIHTYAVPGTYTVKLKAIGANGCTSVYESAAVQVELPAVPRFSMDKKSGCPPLRVRFTDKSKDAAGWMWDFGDGDTATGKNPTHIFTSEGDFTVKLRVLNASGCADTQMYSATIKVKDLQGHYTQPKPITACVPYTAKFSDASTAATAWQWNFGDGDSSTLQYPEHTYSTPGQYTVSLTTTTQEGCKLHIPDYQTIIVKETEAQFSVEVTECPPFTAVCKDSSLNASAWFWNFGDGTTSTAQDPTHIYHKGGNYNITLTITTADGCTDTVRKSISYTPFGASPGPGQVDPKFPVTVDFVSKGVNVDKYEWDFADSTPVSNLPNPRHTFKDSANYIIRLKVMNARCTLTYILTPFRIVKEHEPGNGDPIPTRPFTAEFNTSGLRGCAPLFVQFNNKTAGAHTTIWDFGDGTTSREANPLHTFSKPGIYQVRLAAYGSLGKADTLIREVIVTRPVAGFRMHQHIGKGWTRVEFEDNSADNRSWFWNFGDEETSELQNPVHTYKDTATFYNISLRVTDIGGCSNTTSQMIYTGYPGPIGLSAGSVCLGGILKLRNGFRSYPAIRWDFGDSTTSALPEPAHQYNKAGAYMVTLTLTDTAGNRFTYYAPDSVRVYDPRARGEIRGIYEACDSLLVRFRNTSTGADKFLWNFGDGTTSSLREPEHNYNKPGTYTVTLTVAKNSCKNTYTLPDKVLIRKAEPDYTAKQDRYCLPLQTQFTDASKGAVSWHWDFGDGATSTERNPSHTYQSMPTKPLTLTITDSFGCRGSIQRPAVKLLTAAFASDVNKGCGPLQVKFADRSPYATGWLWDFGDGTTSTDKAPAHRYLNDGSYTVKLIVFSASGCSDTTVIKDFVQVTRPVADFISPDAAACAPSLVHFTDRSQRAVKWQWDFGDGTGSPNKNPSHIYNQPGLYTVKLIVTNAEGCKDSLIRPDYIRVLGPITRFRTSATQGCPGLTVKFSDSSTDAVRWRWNFGDGYTSDEQNPEHTYTEPGNYTPSLITYDQYGCTSVKGMQPGIRIYDRTPPRACPIRRVTVDDPSTVRIEWEQSGDQDFKVYHIYRLNAQTGEWNLAGDVYNPSQTWFNDRGLNTLRSTYTYIVQTEDICGYALPKDSLRPHTTINIEVAKEKGYLRIHWSPYKGASVHGGYTLMHQRADGSFAPIAHLDSGTRSYFDSGAICPQYFSYRVVANELNGAILYSFSDTAAGIPDNRYISQRTDVIRSTVVENRSVLTEWKEPDTLAADVSGYRILRSEDGKDYKEIADVSRFARAYVDSTVDVQRQKYYYRIVPLNECSARAGQGKQGNSIVLTARTEGDRIFLNWNPYESWETGVDYYIIEKLNREGNWEFVRKVNGRVTSTEDEQ